MRKILILIQNDAPGGAQRVGVNLANSLCENNEVYLLIFRKAGNHFFVNSKVKILYLKARYVSLSFYEISKIIKNNNFNFVLSTVKITNIILGLSNLFFNKTKIKTKIIFREANTSDDLINSPYLFRCIKVLFYKFIYSKADKLIANSKDTLLDLKNYNILSENTKTKIISNPIDINNDKSENALLNEKFKFEKDNFYIINCGRIVEQKNQELLIKSFYLVNKEFSHTRLIILGEGHLKEYLKKLVKELNITNVVFFIGNVKNINFFFKNSNLFVLTSKFEGFGNVLVEAMANDLPIISNNCKGAPKEILENGNYGELIDNIDEKKLSKSIKTFIQNPKKYNFKNYISKFDKDSISNKYLDFIET